MSRNAPRTALFLALLAAGVTAHAQDAAHAQSSATPLAPVSVQAAPERHGASVGSIDGASLHDTPASVSVIDRRQLDDRQPRSISDLAKLDASMGDSYASVGYYQDTTIRGYALDLATGFRINDLTVAGAQRFGLENKQSVQILKGLAGLDAGVVAPGGVVNFVTKRPAKVRSVTLGTDSYGSRYTAVDLGGWLTPTFGLRFNGAWEGIHSYVDHANGRRNFYALAADWKISDRAVLRLDSDYQTVAQRSVSGYQLLGGTTLPAHPSRTQMLGYEPWQLPVGIESSNTSARLDYHFSDQWNLRLAAGHSRSVIQDNVAFAYGCFYTAACANGATPGNYFAPNGDYDIYDYRSPDDTRNNDEAKATLIGHVETGALRHTLSLGVDAFRRTVDQRPDVYDYVGSANIDQRNPPVYAPSPNQPGPSARRLTSWQRSALAQDRVQFGDHWQVLAGARFLRLDERAYDSAGAPERHTRFSQTLPQAAVLWQPTDDVTGYVSYSESLSLGQEAPYWTSNDGEILPPLLSRQIETGVKVDTDEGVSLSAALFRIRRPYQFAQPDASAAGYTFVQRGQAVHTGLELGAHGQVTDHLRIDASAAWLRARAQNTGTPSYEGHQVVNVPALRTSVFAEYTLPALPKLALLGGWRYSGAKAATADDRTRVSAYNVFDAGLRYRGRFMDHALTWRLMVNNVFDRFYWRDTGSAFGDYYLFPSAPRLARLSVTWDF
ncbi:TonB-dependent siderophore receptor [Oleiagrimonas soli]|uniref:Iron complex outermembrane receptor protein n=1 Tax=Oleiagrimonas soli TaxID=1543381 RepID=A0A099CWF8_9GAMM|nr:TonB-dependent siderophore receptor [Oleiagrimonas soli]KGI77972.1 TonB-dependent receptor [Oleiagrimonas soli]MBB6183651.1 iron complex outermembrane receptor protein [Oleiagrimonas soli]